MNPSFEFDAPDRVTVGTVGPPGQRTFYVQAREGKVVATLKVEKEQVRELATYLETIVPEPATEAGGERPEDLDLESPIHEDWVVGTIRVAPYDEERQVVHILFEEFVVERPEDDAEAEGLTAHARIALTPAQVASWVARARILLAGGRPTCPLCGNPMNPGGHSCPKTNGHVG